MTLPVPSQRTWAPSDIVTAAMMNANVRDAVNFLANLPMFVGTQTTSQSIPNAAFTAINLDTTTVDTYSGHSNTVNNQRYTAQVAGWYWVSGGCGYDGNATGKRILSITVNGTPQISTSIDASTTNPINVVVPATLVHLNVGDYVTLDAYQQSGAALTLNGNSTYQPIMTVLWAHA